MCACRDETDADIAELVFRAASQIPPGMVSAYGDIALALGDRAASRAVGEILSSNENPVVVPCHRVVAAGGRLGGYSGGLAIKEFLLRLEAESGAL